MPPLFAFMYCFSRLDTSFVISEFAITLFFMSAICCFKSSLSIRDFLFKLQPTGQDALIFSSLTYFFRSFSCERYRAFNLRRNFLVSSAYSSATLWIARLAFLRSRSRCVSSWASCHFDFSKTRFTLHLGCWIMRLRMGFVYIGVCIFNSHLSSCSAVGLFENESCITCGTYGFSKSSYLTGSTFDVTANCDFFIGVKISWLEIWDLTL